MNNFYKNITEHLHDELILVDMLIRREAIKAQYYFLRYKTAGTEKIEKHLAEIETPVPFASEKSKGFDFKRESGSEESYEYKKLNIAISLKREEINNKLEMSLQNGIKPGLILLCEKFKLSQIERGAVLIAMALY